ncbi:MAG TPA: hypothetical protein PL092_02900 [Candidatus Pacearchaeota archaeon]|nr:hypothetical protein [Candidatus Pacearchaeota archaeon]
MNRKLVKDESISYFMMVKTLSFCNSKLFKDSQINLNIFTKSLKGGEKTAQQNLKGEFFI